MVLGVFRYTTLYTADISKIGMDIKSILITEELPIAILYAKIVLMNVSAHLR